MTNLIDTLIKSKTVLLFFISQLLTILFFSFVYWLINHHSESEKHFIGLDSDSPIFDYIYYSLGTSTTVGYGDIVPVSKSARALAMIQLSMIYLGIGVSEQHIIRYMVKHKHWELIMIFSVIIIFMVAPPIAAIIYNFYKKNT